MNGTYYYCGNSGEIEAILREGFTDNVRNTSKGICGVYLADSPGEQDTGYPDDRILEVTLTPEVDTSHFELVTPKAAWREWIVSACILNKHARVLKLTNKQWKQALTKYKNAQAQEKNIHAGTPDPEIIRQNAVAFEQLALNWRNSITGEIAETVDPKLGEAEAAFEKKNEEAYNNNDAAAVAALYTDDAVEVTNRGPVYGRQAIDKYFEGLFKNVHISNYLAKADPVRGIRKGMADNEMWANGEWSATIQVKGRANPIEQKGYWSSIKVVEGDTWKIKMGTFNVTPPPAGAASPTASPSNK